MIKIKDKKAAWNLEQLGKTALIIAILVIVILGITNWSRLQNSWLGNLLPTLGLEKNAPINPDINSQPKELRADDPCVDVYFFWTNDKSAILNGDTVEEGNYYIALNLKSDIGNLNDANNPKYFCKDYALIVTESHGLLNTQFTFNQIQQFAKKDIGGKTYYLVKVTAKDAGWGKSGEYSFNLAKDSSGKTLVRRGFPLHVEHDVGGKWIPFI